MKTRRLIAVAGIAVGVLAAGLGLAGTARAQTNLSVTAWVVAGGGGTSTGGVYALSGTLGQPDAGGPLTNGAFAVTGGFWALPEVVASPGAPTLTIFRGAPGFAQLSWTPAAPGWVLQESLLLTSNWTNSVSGATNPVTVPAGLPRKFYRLFKP